MIQIISGIIILVSIAYYKTGPPIQNFSILNALHVLPLFNSPKGGKINELLESFSHFYSWSNAVNVQIRNKFHMFFFQRICLKF